MVKLFNHKKMGLVLAWPVDSTTGKLIRRINPETMSYKCKSICLSFSFLVCSLLIWRPGACQPSFSETEQLPTKPEGLGNQFRGLSWKDGKIVYQKQFEEYPGDFGATISDRFRCVQPVAHGRPGHDLCGRRQTVAGGPGEQVYTDLFPPT